MSDQILHTLSEVKRNILGPLTVGYYLSAFIFSMMAIIISLRVQARERDPKSPTTPLHFSFAFMVWDGSKKISTGLIVMFLIFRFASEFLHSPLSMHMALGIGFFLSLGINPAIEMMRKRFDWINKMMAQPRDEFMQKLQEKARAELDNQGAPPPAA
jgi:hypothetical protein